MLGRKLFIADGMLGKLSRWLRLLGYDVIYSHDAGDDELLGEAKATGRILLTKDLNLYKRARVNGVEAVMLRGKNLEEDLAYLASLKLINLTFNEKLTRCPLCNSKLNATRSKRELEDIIPKNVLERYNFFWICSECGKVYWLGSHWQSINRTLMKARLLLKGYERNL